MENLKCICTGGVRGGRGRSVGQISKLLILADSNPGGMGLKPPNEETRRASGHQETEFRERLALGRGQRLCIQQGTSRHSPSASARLLREEKYST